MPGIGVTASAVRITPCMIQGWRPTSVTVHPASTAIKPIGVAKANSFKNQAFLNHFLHFEQRNKIHQRQAPSSAYPNPPSPGKRNG